MMIKRLFERFKGKTPEARSLNSARGWTDLAGLGTTAGVRVTPGRALGIPAALAAVRLISESVSALPLSLYRRQPTGGRERAREHPLQQLLHEGPADGVTPYQLKECLMLGLLLHGNGYALISYDKRGLPVSLQPLPAESVSVEQDAGTGRVSYKLSTFKGTVELSKDEVLHVPGLSFDGIRGVSVISLAREALGTGIAEIQHGSSFFSNAAMPAGVLTHPGLLSEAGLGNLRQSFEDRYKGSRNANKTLILEEGMTFSQLQFSQKDSQFIESRNFTVREIARIFRVPPALIGDIEKASYSSQEAQALEFLVYTLRPWLTRIQESIDCQLLTTSEKQTYYSEFNANDLLRTTAKERFESYQTALTAGWLSVNEVRALENLPAVPGGDAYMYQLNLGKLDDIPAKDQEARQEPGRDADREKLRTILEGFLVSEYDSLKALEGDIDYQAAVSQYFDNQPEKLSQAVKPVIVEILRKAHETGSSEIGRGTWTREEFEGYVDEYLQKFSQKFSAIGKVTALAVINDDEIDLGEHYEEAVAVRPSKVIESDMTTAENLMLLETFRRGGIQKIRWQAQGGACSLCSSLNGKVVGIDNAFLAAGEGIAAGGKSFVSSRPRLTPGLHTGCRCRINAEPGI